MRPPDVVGVSEIAEMKGVTPQRADQIMRLPSAPPGRQLKMGTVWSRPAVVKFLAIDRKPGRRPKG